jgi:putative tryptophan/tyrosine transport system substrate-binding protein
MKRRTFIGLMGGAAASPLVARAQQPAKMKRLAIVHPTTKPEELSIGGDPDYSIILEDIKRRGYVEGVNLSVDRYSANGRPERFSEIAHQIVATRPDVIFALADPVVLALQAETRTIPIVGWTGDPIISGIVSNIGRPGGNVTGVSITVGADFGGKVLQLFVDAVGKLSNVRVLAIRAEWEYWPYWKPFRETAERMKIPVQLEPLQTPVDEAEYRRAFDAMQRDHVDGVVIGPALENYNHRYLLGPLAQQYRLPAFASYVETVESGALMSYAWDHKAADRRLAAQIVDILNGNNPAEMPYFQETHWELLINLKAAKELGLEIPAGLVAQADRVIE